MKLKSGVNVALAWMIIMLALVGFGVLCAILAKMAGLI